MIVGFGEEREAEIYAGDGKTLVKTALRSDKIKEAVREANAKNLSGQGFRFIKGAEARFVDATEIGSAQKVLASLSSVSGGEEEATLAYELQNVDRHKLFIASCVRV